jgi:hypothetical protein
MRRQRATISGPERLQLLAAVPAPRVELGDALGTEQALDAVRVPDPLLDERLALTGNAPHILLLRAGWHDHGADPRLAALPRQQRAQQSLAVDGISLGTPLAPRDGNGGGIHDMAFDAFGC